ncbi:MAG: OsmC family protein, partial [Raineya sp.]|nr:OsmC family protein [Raineya sp.]
TMEKVQAILENEDYVVTIQNGRHALISDEPESIGGKDKGMNPHELLCASLASCTLATLRMYAERKNWKLGTIIIEVQIKEITVNGTKKAHFYRHIRFEKPLSSEQRERLKQIADACPISKILKSGENIIETYIA